MNGTGTKARIKQIAWIAFAATSSPVLAANAVTSVFGIKLSESFIPARV
jgi:hypothetical protein